MKIKKKSCFIIVQEFKNKLNNPILFDASHLVEIIHYSFLGDIRSLRRPKSLYSDFSSTTCTCESFGIEMYF